MSMSNPPNNGKSVGTASQPSQAQAAVGSAATGDTHGQRRVGGSGSFGAGASSRTSPVPRNSQSSRKQHKPSKRFRLADEDGIAVSAAMRSANSRKGQTSITHLMNFTLPPRPQNYSLSQPHGRNGRRNPTWGVGSGYHAVDKARYVHANNRFIVDPRADYQSQSVDADIHLDWDNILQILVSPQSQAVLSSQSQPLQSSESRLVVCPICLQAPVAPRMTKCGHIFCLPCLIAFMNARTEEDHSHAHDRRPRWKKCPVCADSIYLSDVKPVRWYTGQQGQTPTPGEDIVLRLVKRDADSTLALPRDRSNVSGKDEDIPWHFAADVMDYARIMKGSESYIVDQYDHEIEDVQKREKEDELLYGDGDEWTKKAVRMIREGKEKLKGMGNPQSMPVESQTVRLDARPPIRFNDSEESVPDMYMIHHDAKSGRSISAHSVTPRTESDETASLESASVPGTECSTRNGSEAGRRYSTKVLGQQPAANLLASTLADYRNRRLVEQQPSEYYFYQALPHYYLSPLDIRILKAAFGSYASFPSTILPRVEHVSADHQVDELLRKRVKYLAHLPYGCEVNFLECDWTDTVDAAVLERFKSDIERRRKKNADKEAREEKERVRAEKEEDERYAAARRKRVSPTASDRFRAEDFQPLAPSSFAHPLTAAEENGSSTSPPWPARRGQGSAFASLASPSTSPSASRTVWGTAAVPPSSRPQHVFTEPEPEAVDDGWLQGWERDLLREDELVAQVEAASLEGTRGSNATPGSSKKKKNKKITLMTTNGRRGA